MSDGHSLMAPQNGTEWVPTLKQKAVLRAAAEVGLERNISAVCKEAQVDRKSFYRWLKHADFRDAWEAVWHGAIRHHLPGVVAAQLDKALKGDTQAARLIADMGGVLKQKHELTGKDGGPIETAGGVSTLEIGRRIAFVLNQAADMTPKKLTGND